MSLALVAALASCGGGGAGTGPIAVDPIALDNAAGRSFAGIAQQTRSAATGFGPVGPVALDIKVIDGNQVEVTVNKSPPVLLTYDAGADGFLSADRTMLLEVYPQDEGGTRPLHMVLFKLYRSDFAGDYVDTLIDGNRTPFVNMPDMGGATYEGVVESVDGLYRSGTGTITLNADFRLGTIDGRLDGVLPLDEAAEFTLVPTMIEGRGFETVLQSTDVAVSEGVLGGHFYGPAAEQAGGTFRVQTDGGNATGYFSANR